jgi:hypothetical protein
MIDTFFRVTSFTTLYLYCSQDTAVFCILPVMLFLLCEWCYRSALNLYTSNPVIALVISRHIVVCVAMIRFL